MVNARTSLLLVAVGVAALTSLFIGWPPHAVRADSAQEGRAPSVAGSVAASGNASAASAGSAASRPSVKLPPPFVREDGSRRLPDFVFQEALPSGDRKELGFVDLRGRPIVAVSWATWCGVCAKDLPKLDRLRAALEASSKDHAAGAEAPAGGRAAKPLVATFSIDDLSPERVDRHLEQRGLSGLRSFHDTDKMFFLTTSGVGVPSAIIADAEGRIVARAQGAVDWNDPAIVAFLDTLSN